MPDCLTQYQDLSGLTNVSQADGNRVFAGLPSRQPVGDRGCSMRRNRDCRRRMSRVRGLAPLELVLALPLLLLVMALMINFGTLACWKIRALTVARNALWESRWPRTPSSNPRPVYWPVGANVSVAGGQHVPQIDDPRVDQPVARGPTLPGGTIVNRDLLDPTRGLRTATAGIERPWTMIANLGSYRLRAETCMIDDKWQYQRTGLSSNYQRRIDAIWALAKAPPALSQAYVQAVVNILQAPFRASLAPLDRDPEHIYYGQLFGWGRSAPDYHPGLQRFCSLDRELADVRVTQLVERIEGKIERDSRGRIVRRVQGVPERMTQGFISLYQRVINQYRRLGIPAEAEIRQLEQKIEVLRAYLQALQRLQEQQSNAAAADHRP